MGRRVRRRRDGKPLLAAAGDRPEVGERGRRVGGEDDEGVLRPSPARGGEEGVGGGPGEEEDLTGGGPHRLARERLLGGGTAVDLAAGRRAEVVALGREVAAPLDGVGPRRDGLRLQRLELVVDARPHLERDDAEEVLLEADPVDDVKRPARRRHEEDVSAIAGVVHREERAVRRLQLQGRRDLPHPVRSFDEEGADRRTGSGEADEERLGNGVAPHARQERLERRPAARLAEPDAPSPPASATEAGSARRAPRRAASASARSRRRRPAWIWKAGAAAGGPAGRNASEPRCVRSLRTKSHRRGQRTPGGHRPMSIRGSGPRGRRVPGAGRGVE